MKKIVSLFIIIATIAVLLVGCATDDSDGVELISIPLTQEEYAFGVDKNQPELLAQVNAFIAQSLEDGSFEEICNKYFSDGEPTAVTSAAFDEKKDQLVVATNAMFAPFEYVEGNKFYGIDMELAAALADSLGKELVIMDMDFEAVCLSVSQGKCDLAMAGLTVNESRREHVVFTSAYYQASQVLIVRRGDKTFADCTTADEIEAVLDSLGTSTKIGVQTGTTGQYFLEGDEDFGFEGFGVTCVGYQSAALAVQDLLNANLDFVLLDEAPAEILVAQKSGSMRQNIEKFWDRFLHKGGYTLVLEGLKNTLIIAFSGLLIGIFVGTLIAAVRVMPKYKRLPRILNGICGVYVGFFRGTPIVVQLLLGYYVLLPLLGLNYPPLTVCVVVFGLNSGAYVSEIMRGGIRSVDRGQLEGGRAVGLSYFVTMMRIVIPQAVKNILPTLGNELISLIKETSIVSFVSAVDIYKAFNIIATNSYEYIVPYLAMAVVYIVLVAVVTLLIKWMERRLARSDRHSASEKGI